LVLVVLAAESWGLLIGGVFMDAKTAQVGLHVTCAAHAWVALIRIRSGISFAFALPLIQLMCLVALR
jgi:hypothetical protein